MSHSRPERPGRRERLSALHSTHASLRPSRRRHPPRDLLPRLLQLARQVGVAPLELPFFLLESQHLAAKSSELASQGVDVVEVDGLWRSATRRRRRRRSRSDGDLLVRRPRHSPHGRGLTWALDARLDVLPGTVSLRVARDLPLAIGVSKAVADAELVREDRHRGLRARADGARASVHPPRAPDPLFESPLGSAGAVRASDLAVTQLEARQMFDRHLDSVPFLCGDICVAYEGRSIDEITRIVGADTETQGRDEFDSPNVA